MSPANSKGIKLPNLIPWCKEQLEELRVRHVKGELAAAGALWGGRQRNSVVDAGAIKHRHGLQAVSGISVARSM